MFYISVIIAGGKTLLKLDIPTEDQSALVEECTLDPKYLADQVYLTGRLLGYPDPLLPFISVEASIFAVTPKIIWNKRLISINAGKEIVIELDIPKKQVAQLKMFDADTRKYVYTPLNPEELHEELDKRVQRLKLALDKELKAVVFEIGVFDES